MGKKIPYNEIECKNQKFEEYYKSQNMMSEQEFTEFMEILKQPLPTSFRFTEQSSKENEEEVAGELDAQKLTWCPRAYMMDKTRQQLRKDEKTKKHQQLLVNQNLKGLICRQEAVSMVPILALDLQQNHCVLDMCASPGSKTSQILDKVKNGLVVANDVDPKRTHVLIHNLKKLNNPNLIVTNNDAQFFPNVGEFLFDRVLADVPCSGDGTLRKNKLIWRTWNSNIAKGLQPVQKRILSRAIELTKKGGLIVYSTCSFNPVENEQVVQYCLDNYPVKLKKIEIKGLKTRCGLEEMSDCIRILPMDQNTGGFFIALLEKVDKTSFKLSKKHISPVKFMNMEDIKEVFEDYGIDLDPEDFVSSLEQKIIYKSCKKAREYLLSCGSGNLFVQMVGIKVFVRCTDPATTAKYRLSNFGLQLIKDKITKRIIQVTNEEMQMLLKQERPKIEKEGPLGGVVIQHNNERYAGWLGKRAMGLFINKI